MVQLAPVKQSEASELKRRNSFQFRIPFPLVQHSGSDMPPLNTPPEEILLDAQTLIAAANQQLGANASTTLNSTEPGTS